MFTSKYLAALFITCLLLLSACSNTSEPKTEGFFHTEIRDDNSKEFTFSLVFSRSKEEASRGMKNASTSQRPDKGKGSGKGRGNRSHEASSTTKPNSKSSSKADKMQGIFQQHLDLKMQETKYCRTGYLILEQSFIGAVYSLRGECNESATEEDRKKSKQG